jgi:hypothetical protein
MKGSGTTIMKDECGDESGHHTESVFRRFAVYMK